MTPRKQQRPEPAQVILTERALSDLRQIEHYSVAEWGTATARKYIADVATALDRIAENPDLLRHEPDFSSGLFFYRMRKHILVCDRRERSIYVLTVIHTSMDIPARLMELEPTLAAEVNFLHKKLRDKPHP